MFVAFAFFAVTQASSPDCDNAQTQAVMNYCAAQDFRRADAELNALWNKVIADAREAEKDYRSYNTNKNDERPSSDIVLRNAQRAWLKFRDNHCAWEAYGEARGGSMEPMVYESCRARLTAERLDQLRGPTQ